MDRFLCVFLCFSLSVLLLMMTSLNSYRCFGIILKASLYPVPLFSRNVFSLNTFFSRSLEVWSQFFLFLSLHAFQLLANHFLLSESNVCEVAQWCDLLVKAKADSKPFTVVLDQNQLMWVCRMDFMCEVCEMLSAHLTFTLKFTNSKPLTVTLAHVSLNRESDLWSYIICNPSDK